MATLYLARRHGAAGFSRLAAIKVVHPHLFDQPKFVDMFVDEARICSQISHPNVVHVEEFGEIDGLHYLVMEYIDGCSANELLQMLRDTGRRLEVEVAANVVLQVARGLHAAHETCGPDGEPLDIIHRDITPSNILLSRAGHVKLIDFGIAKARNRLSETESGFALKGKYRYVAPEQATRIDLDRRTDIFSLGVVFWELLTGEQLFDDDTHVGLFNRLNETVVRPPSSVNPAISPELDELVLAMLKHDREERPATAQEVYKWITAVIPPAVTVEADEIGRLVAEVLQRPSRASTEDRLADESFSPVPRRTRSFQTQAPLDYRIEVVPPPVESPTIAEPSSRPGTVPGIGPAPAPVPAPLPPAPPARRGRLAALIGGVLATGVVIGVIVARGGGGKGRANAPASMATEPVELPTTTVPPTGPAPVAPAETATTPPNTPSNAVAAQPAEEVVVEVPVAPARATAPVSTTPKRAATTVSTQPVRKAPATTTVARPATTSARVAETAAEETPRPATDQKARTFRAGKTTFVDAEFDDTGNTSTSTTATKPSRAKVKSTTIVTDFE